MNEKLKPGTYGAIIRSTEEEFQQFRRALNKLFFTKEEFINEGPFVIMRKYDECVAEMEKVK